MTKTPFMPPLNSRWRLLTDVDLSMPVVHSYYNLDVITNRYALKTMHEWLEERGNRNGDWGAEWRHFDAEQLPAMFTIPRGTVVSFNRYHVSNSGSEQITIQFLASPDPMLTPKKLGGKGKGPMRFYLNLGAFNQLGPLEEVLDVLD